MQAALDYYWNVLFYQFNHALYCSSSSLSTPMCHGFWMWSLFIVEAAGLLIFVPILNREYQKYRGRKSYLKWLAEYEKVADADVMAKVSWKGHTYVDADLSHEELSAQIRQELATRRDVSA